MAEIKYLEIDSVAPHDVTELFKAICKKVIDKSPEEVWRGLFKMKGSDKVLAEKKADINELLTLISFFDIPVSLKVQYVDSRFKEKKMPYLPDEGESLSMNNENLEIEKQTAEISNPELKVVAKEANEVKPCKEPNPQKIPGSPLPEIPDFNV